MVLVGLSDDLVSRVLHLCSHSLAAHSANLRQHRFPQARPGLLECFGLGLRIKDELLPRAVTNPDGWHVFHVSAGAAQRVVRVEVTSRPVTVHRQLFTRARIVAAASVGSPHLAAAEPDPRLGLLHVTNELANLAERLVLGLG